MDKDGFDDPMGLMHFECVELASPTPDAIGSRFGKPGFSGIARLRGKDLLLYQPGGIDLAASREPEHAARLHRREFGKA